MPSASATARRTAGSRCPGIGPKTAKVIAQAWAGREPDALVELRSAAQDLGGGDVRAALRGDLHVHSNWSDGSAPIEEMMLAARDLGHEYCALTDHSPRLTIANGLSPERLRRQLDVIDELRETVAPMRILTGIEVDILEDGSLDQEPELLDRLDVVVASVHSKLKMDAPAMTRRMIKAVRTLTRTSWATARAGSSRVAGVCGRSRSSTRRRCSPHAGTTAPLWRSIRGRSAAIRRRGCSTLPWRSAACSRIDTDSHAPGQLDFLGYGAQRALDARGAGGPDRQHVDRPTNCSSGRPRNVGP